MKIAGKNIVITGGASGIGKALALRFHQEGAKSITVADLQEGPLTEVAKSRPRCSLQCGEGSGYPESGGKSRGRLWPD